MSRQNCSQLYVYDSFSKCHEPAKLWPTISMCMKCSLSLNITNKTVANYIHVYDSLSKCHDKTVANYMCMTRSLNVTNKTVANCMFMTRSLNVTNKTVANCMCMIRSLNVTNKTVATLLQIATVHSSS